MLVGNEAARLYLQTRNDPAESARMITAATAAHVPWLAPTYAATSPLQKPTRLHRATLWTRERRGLLAWMPRRGCSDVLGPALSRRPRRLWPSRSTEVGMILAYIGGGLESFDMGDCFVGPWEVANMASAMIMRENFPESTGFGFYSLSES